jgi:hypothetical protein
LVHTREVPSQTRDKQDGGIILLHRIIVKCSCHRLKFVILYYKRVIALILRNMVPRNVSYCTRKLVQYYVLLETIFLNIFNSFGNVLLLRYIYKGRLVKTSANIAFSFYKEIYMKKLIVYYNVSYFVLYHFQQYFNYILAFKFYWRREPYYPKKNHRYTASNWHCKVYHNVVTMVLVM